MNQNPLTKQKVSELAGAFARLQELSQSTISTPTSEAEKKGLTEFVGQILFEHAPEFIGCWFTVRQEYEPLLNIFAVAGRRIAGINAQINSQQSAEQK